MQVPTYQIQMQTLANQPDQMQTLANQPDHMQTRFTVYCYPYQKFFSGTLPIFNLTFLMGQSM